MAKASLVLGGGASRGFYHLGVLRAIQERKIIITDIVGCSVGALIGAIYASRPDEDVSKIVEDLALAKLIEPKFRSSSFLGTAKLERALRAIIPCERFEELKIPLTVVATDINTGAAVTFSSGELFPALLASMAIPGIFPTVEHAGKLLVDGGVVENVPVKYAKSKHVIVSDVNFPLRKITKSSGKMDAMLNAIYIMIRKSTHEQLQDAKERNITLTYLALNKEMFAGDLRKAKLKALILQGYADAVKGLGN